MDFGTPTWKSSDDPRYHEVRARQSLCSERCARAGSRPAWTGRVGRSQSDQVRALRVLDPPALDLTPPPATVPQQLPAGPLQVLLVDADPATQALVNRVLVGHEVIVASDGQTAIDICALMDFDVLLIDLQAAGMSGAEVASLLRAQGHTSPMVALTAGKREAALRPCLLAGMNGLLSKPLQEPELLAALAQVLAASSPG